MSSSKNGAALDAESAIELDAAIDSLIEEYAACFQEFRKDEIYKWEAVKCFQDNWDPDATDFAAILERALAKSGNLLSGSKYFPMSMLTKEFATINPKKTRHALVDVLFDENQELIQRMKDFSTLADELFAEFRETGRGYDGMKHHQDPRAMSVYLAFKNPGLHYLYKWNMYKSLADRLGVGIPSNKYECVVEYNKLCDRILERLNANFTGLIAKSDELVPNELREYDPEHHLLVQDIAYYVNSYADRMSKEGDGKGLTGSAALGDDANETRYWIISPGHGAVKWDEFHEQGIIAIGWRELGDIRQYASKEEITQALRATYGGTGSKKNDTCCLWDFANSIKPGDIVYAKKGQSIVLGRGIVRSGYEFNPAAGEYPHIHSVEWTNTGSWPHPGNAATKTLTDITTYTGYVAKLEALFADDEGNPPVLPEVIYEPYGKEDFLADVFLPEPEYDKLVALLRTKKNVILQGAPGVGKTFMAKRLAYSMMGERNAERVKLVQFHQSYSYEDFIMGYRPSQEGFELKTGAFYDFCEKARKDEANDYFFIIDEINRGNLSKIFGELFMLIENDKRGVPLQLLYSDELFSVPANLYIVGMMNTADRSLAMLDYALRRRFAFYEIEPAFTSDGFNAYLEALDSEPLDRLVRCVEQLNNAIASDDSLGRGFRIGHSYFCGLKAGEVDKARLEQIVDFELVPMLEEYWFDEPAKVHDWKRRLKTALG